MFRCAVYVTSPWGGHANIYPVVTYYPSDVSYVRDKCEIFNVRQNITNLQYKYNELFFVYPVMIVESCYRFSFFFLLKMCIRSQCPTCLGLKKHLVDDLAGSVGVFTSN